jgi:hypothetical protein
MTTLWLVWRFQFSRPQFLCVCKSAKAASKAVAKAGTPGWTVTPVPVRGTLSR